MSNNPILDMLFHTWQFSAMSTAHRLGVFSRLDERAMSAAELARETYSVPHLLEAVLDACVAIGLLHREQGRYANSHLSSAYLVEGRPLYLGHILEVQARDAARWAHAYDIVKTGEVPDFPGEVGEQDATFTLAMNDLGAQGEAEALAGAVDLSRCGTLLDIGCGSGLYSITLCRHYPQLVAILVDREVVLHTTERLVAASGLAGRIRVRAGDMATDAFEDGMDAVLLSDSLYFDETISTRILRSAYRALNPGGIVIIRGYYPDPEGAESLFGAIFRINLLLFEPNRRPPAVADIARQLVEVGFSGTRMFALTERSTCFIGIK
jgi:SAM-dependent methyltransferase